MTTSPVVLVLGGAGYIGAHTLRALLDAGYSPVVYDNFSTGHRAAVPPQVPVVAGDLADVACLQEALKVHQPVAAIHFAASIEAGESMIHPRRFYHNNVVNSLRLFDTLLDAGVTRVVFSSSAGVYGQPESVPIPEHVLKQPVNTYGLTKWMMEQILQDYDRAYHLRSISLRYFNAAGAHPDGSIGEAHPTQTHLIELACLAALGRRDVMRVFGTDYPTPDGTAIRDYVHVCDLATAHVLALDALLHDAPTTAYNVGLGHGFSVREVLDQVEKVSGVPFARRLEARRPGDPAALVADARRIRQELGWSPVFTDLSEIIATAWRWHSTHPDGFALSTPAP